MKFYLGLALTGCFLLAGALRVAVRSQVRTRTELTHDVFVERITTDVWRHVSFGNFAGSSVSSNGLMVKSGAEVLLVDTAWNDAQTKQLLDWMEQEWQTKVSVAVITHFHEDRLGGIRELHRRGIHTVSSQRTAQLARQHNLEPPQQTFDGSRMLTLGKRQIEAVYLGPGHTQDNVVVWLPEVKILFGGCLIKSAQAPDLGNIKDADLKLWPKTMERVLQKFGQAQIVVPGHGDPTGIEAVHHTLTLLKQKLPQAGK